MTVGIMAAGAVAFTLIGTSAPVSPADDDFDVPEPPGYRTQEYRSPVPKTLRDAKVVSTEEAAALWRRGDAAFVDVLPQPPRPRNLPAGTIWRDATRYAIPGSLWLPDTGYGELAPVTEAYFAKGLAHVSGGDRGKPIVFYCLKDCWMSWNAAKRAIARGYTNIIWFPDGTDGWQAAGLPLEEVKPEPRAE